MNSNRKPFGRPKLITQTTQYEFVVLMPIAPWFDIVSSISAKNRYTHTHRLIWWLVQSSFETLHQHKEIRWRKESSFQHRLLFDLRERFYVVESISMYNILLYLFEMKFSNSEYHEFISKARNKKSDFISFDRNVNLTLGIFHRHDRVPLTFSNIILMNIYSQDNQIPWTNTDLKRQCHG